MPSVEKLRDLVAEAKTVVAFTGAGISTECGIPDFRSPGGFWTKNRPIDFREFVADPAARREAWSRFLKLRDEHLGVKPGRGHMALAGMQASGKLSHVITQNIDNLHQDSGLPPDAIIELHGNGTYAKCLDCEERHELDWCADRFRETEECPRCKVCGGLVKTATISFGQAMPQDQMMRAEAATLGCDLFIAIGSSLSVQPAAGFPLIAAQNGAKLVIINRDETPLDGYAELALHADIGDTLSAVV